MFGMDLADCRHKAEEQLKTDLAALGGSDDYKAYLSAFGDFASALFDAEASSALGDWDTVDSYRSFLQSDLAPRIIEGILPDRGVAEARSKWSPEIAAVSTERDMDSETIWECLQDGSRVPAREEIQAAYAQHGDWEVLAPKSVRWKLRIPRVSADVRETIRQLLERRMFTWLDRFPLNQQTLSTNIAVRRLEFSPQHRADFQELLAMGVNVYSLNSGIEKSDFGPWTLMCEQGDAETKTRLIRRFRAVVRKAAINAGAPHRAHLVNWWIRKLARGRGLPYIQGLIERSIEFCQELESNSLESRPIVDEEDARPGLSRDRYPCDRPVAYWLYATPHSVLRDPKEEFEFWSGYIWDGFNSGVQALADLPQRGRHWVDKAGEHRVELKDDTRRRVGQRVKMRTELLDALILGLSYDLAVLHAHYALDRGLGKVSALRAYDEEARANVAAIRQAWHAAANSLGLSGKKQGLRRIDLGRPFREVRADFRALVESNSSTSALGDTSGSPDPFSGDWLYMAVTRAVPTAQGRIDLPLRILKDHLTRELITPELAWKELRAIPSDDRYSSDLRRRISNELAHLSPAPTDVVEPAMDALRNILRARVDSDRRKGVKIVIDRIVAPPEIKDYEAAKRHEQRLASRAAVTASDTSRPESDEIPLNSRQVHAPVVQQQRKFCERRYTLPSAPDKIKGDVRGLAHASILLVTRDSSVPAAEVDDWLDRLKQHGYAWDTMDGLLHVSIDHLTDLRRDELAARSLEQALRLEALIGDFEKLLAGLNVPNAINPGKRSASSHRLKPRPNLTRQENVQGHKAGPPSNTVEWMPAPAKIEAPSEKGNFAILQGPDGNLKRAVTLEIARRFGGVSRRAIDAAAKKGSLRTEGRRQQRRVLVASLIEYFPPEK